MSKHKDSSVASVGHAGHSAGALIEGGMRRILVVATLAVGAVLLVASVAFACTTYWGQITIENISDGSGEFSVVADPTSGMDRCDDAMDGNSAPISADNGQGSRSSEGPDTVRVEISKWEPGDQDPTGRDCGLEDDDFGNDDDADDHNEEKPEHSLADANVSQVDINTHQYSDAYNDDDGDGVYEDTDCSLLSCYHGNETNGEASTEREYDCMSGSEDIRKESDVPVLDYGNDPDNDGEDDGGEFDPSDARVNDDDGDGVYDVEIDIDTAPDSPSDRAGAICVSESDGSDSAPQVPIVIQ